MSSSVKITYIIMSAIVQITILAGGAYLTHVSGPIWWVVGGVLLSLAHSYGFTKRLDSWGDMGKI